MKLVLAALSALSALPAFAANYGQNPLIDSSVRANASAYSAAMARQEQGQAQGQAQNVTVGGNSQTVSVTPAGVSLNVQEGSRDVAINERQGRNTPAFGLGNVYPTAPCMGSSQVGGSGVGFSIGIGTSWTDDECGIRETSRSFQTLGLTGDAVKVLCTSKYAAAAPVCKN